MRVRFDKILRTVAILGLIALVPLLAACSKSTPQSTGGSQAAPAKTSAAQPTIKVTAPTAGAEVAAGTVTVTVETTGLKFTMPSNTNVAGQGHVHFTLDDRPFDMSVEPKFDFKDVTPGSHTLKAELVQNNTDSFDPPVTEVVEFTAK